jgi:hypothetical protein
MTPFSPNTKPLTPAQLTAILSTCGVLEKGRVTLIDWDTQTFNQGYTSQVALLKPHYSKGSAGKRPANLFYKHSRTDTHPEIQARGRREVEFYRAMGSLPPTGAIPACYYAAADEAGEAGLILEDLSPTHMQRPLPIPPSNRLCELIVESLAQLHAQWWNHPDLGTRIGARLTEEQARQSRLRLEGTFPQFVDYLGDALLPAQRGILERTLASSYLTRLAERLSGLRQVTLIHGDAYTGNLMLPRDPLAQRVVLVDWHLWDIHIATFDLAFLIALHWNTTRRAILEIPLLRHYHAQLAALGVENYPWVDFWNDYRLGVILMTLIPIGQFRRGSPAGVVWFGLQDSLAAFGDLNCAELL